MAHKLITGITFHNKWKIIKVDSDWKAWIMDPKVDDTGAPEVSGVTFEATLDKIKLFEEGQQYANTDN